MGRDFHFEKQVALGFLPLMWVAAVLLTVGMSGELGCALPEGWRCEVPWSDHKRTMLGVLVFGPPMVIWVLTLLIKGFARYFSHPH